LAIEDFTTYTELDLGGDLTVTASKIDIDTVAYGQDDSVVSKDFGVNYFDEWTHYFSFEATAMANSSGFFIGAVSNVVDEWFTLWDANADAVGLFVNKGSTGNLGCYFRDANTHNSDAFIHAVGTQYWCTFTRTGTTAVLHIYDDSGRTHLVDTLTITTADVNYRYVLPYTATNYLTYTGTASGYIENLDLQLQITPTESVVISRDIHLGGL